MGRLVIDRMCRLAREIVTMSGREFGRSDMKATNFLSLSFMSVPPPREKNVSSFCGLKHLCPLTRSLLQSDVAVTECCSYSLFVENMR